MINIGPKTSSGFRPVPSPDVVYVCAFCLVEVTPGIPVSESVRFYTLQLFLNQFLNPRVGDRVRDCKVVRSLSVPLRLAI